jgi:hypothetical protein
MRTVAIALRAMTCSVALIVAPCASFADDQSCIGFNWPVDTEVGWMSAADADTVQSGATIAAAPAKAVVLTLKPSKSETLPVMSGVAQNGKLTDSTGFTGRRDCAVLRKSVRYELATGETLIQIVGSPTETIKVTIKPAN